MKKFLSAAVSAAMAVTSVLPFAGTASAADDTKNIVVLGDSIASGYGLSKSEHNYGELLGDYYGTETANYAVSGAETGDLIGKLEKPSEDIAASIKNADCVVVSIGGNDMIHYASSYLLNICANINVLKSGYTSKDVPEDPTLGDVINLVDIDALKAYALDNPLVMNSNVQKLRANIVEKDNGKYDCLIQKKVMPNIEKIYSDIKSLNPEAQVVYQTLYDPLQFDAVYYEKAYTGTTKTVMNMLKPVSAAIVESYNTQLSEAQLGDTLIADIYADFTSLDENGGKYSWYFTKMQEDRAEMDFHPTQAGHVAIAAKVIETIGTRKGAGKLISDTFNSLPAKESYPAAALATYNKVTADVSSTLGDPNNDGKVDAKDASFILVEYSKLSTGEKSELTAAEKEAADVNGDKFIDAKDASAVLGYYAYISTGGTKTIAEYLGL